jgi:hypothetical protein
VKPRRRAPDGQRRVLGHQGRRPCSAAYLLEEATTLWREPTVKLQ